MSMITENVDVDVWRSCLTLTPSTAPPVVPVPATTVTAPEPPVTTTLPPAPPAAPVVTSPRFTG